jgi:hypothetical protein
MLFAAAATMIGVAVLLIIPKWLSYTAELNARKQREALDRRWFKTPAE